MKRALLALALIATDALAAGGATVVGSKHDLSLTGPGPIKATRQGNACVFCHAMHGGGKGLSSRPDSTAKYQPYESGTIKAKSGAPTGSSRVCLSCHDGTIAVGQTTKGRWDVTGTTDGKIPPTRRSHLGTDLRASHPFSIATSGSPTTHAPAAHGHVKLDGQGLVQCTSCHDPHAEYGGSTEGKFLVQPTARAELCTSCHISAADGSHATATNKFVAGQEQDATYLSVAESGCMACHRSHGAATKGQILKMSTSEVDEDVCLRCHGTLVQQDGGRDVGRQLTKMSTHRVRNQGSHQADEGPRSALHPLPEKSIGAMRHATCVDCHEPHQAKHRPTQSQRLSGALDGVWGIDELGNRIDAAQYEYQICFKCHGDSMNQSAIAASAVGARRTAQDRNLRLVFGSTAISSHPVVARGQGTRVPSLKAPLTVASTILCSDCHSSDDGPAAGTGGTGTAGPHGSVYAPLLERNYSTTDFTAESSIAYALCYKCHDRSVLFSTSSSFNRHQTHVQNDNAPCSACHSAHGVSATKGTGDANAHLVDFDLNIVKPNGGQPAYSANGRSCNLTCHGQRHDGFSYAGPLPTAAKALKVKASR